MRDELELEVGECQLLEFDDDFPFEGDPIEDEHERNTVIHRILNRIINGPLRSSTSVFDDLDLNVTQQQMDETHKLYREHIKTWGPFEANILYFLTLSRVSGDGNLMLNLVDAYRRWAVERMLKNLETGARQWIEMSPKLQKLEQRLKDATVLNATFSVNKDLASAINTYAVRIAPILNPNPDRVIDYNLERVVSYITSSGMLVEWVFSLDFLFLFATLKEKASK